MSENIIAVSLLGKKYRLGKSLADRRFQYRTFREALTDKLLSPFRCFSKAQKPDPQDIFWALKGVTFDVRRGEIMGVIGRNGAGKSTLLKILSGITEPTEGKAEISGRVGSLLEVGTGFHPELTGRENIYLNGAILGMKRREIMAKFESIVEFAEVARFIDTPVKHYSSGMYLRLAFSVAAHLDPEILLVDEVLAVGDAIFQKKCLGKMNEVTKEGRTVLFVSHNMGAMESLCSRIIWLDGGKVRKIGPAKAVISQYLLESVSSAQSVQPGNTGKRFNIEKVFLKNSKDKITTIFAPGEDFIVEVHFYAGQKIEKPHVWIGISSQYGPLFGADMTIDGRCPEFIDEGPGSLACHFQMPVLLPQTYTVRMGAREKDGVTFLTQTAEVAAFRIEAAAKDYELRGPQSETALLDSSPLFIPYAWRLPSGQTVKLNAKFRKNDHG